MLKTLVLQTNGVSFPIFTHISDLVLKGSCFGDPTALEERCPIMFGASCESSATLRLFFCVRGDGGGVKMRLVCATQASHSLFDSLLSP